MFGQNGIEGWLAKDRSFHIEYTLMQVLGFYISFYGNRIKSYFFAAMVVLSFKLMSSVHLVFSLLFPLVLAFCFYFVQL